MKILNSIRCTDFLGYNFNIRINRESGYKSVLGGVLSIFIIILSSIMIFYLGIEIIQKKEPIVLNSNIQNKDFGPYDILFKSQIQFLIGLEFANFTYYYDESIYTVSAEESTVEYQEINGTTTQILKTRPIRLRKCSEIYTNSDVEEDNLNIPLDLFVCVDPEEKAQIQGFWGSRISKSLKVKLNKCQNSTNYKVKCRSKKEIDNYIQNGVLSIYTSDYLVDHKNLTNPTKKYFRDVYNYLSGNYGLIYVIAYSDFLFKSDTGFLFPIYYEWNRPMISDIKNSYSFGEKDMFAFINFQGFKLAQSYQRTYSKIQDILTKVGGLIKALTLIGFAINYVFSRPFFIINNILDNHNLMKIHQISKAYNFPKENEKNNKNLIFISKPRKEINPKINETMRNKSFGKFNYYLQKLSKKSFNSRNISVINEEDSSKNDIYNKHNVNNNKINCLNNSRDLNSAPNNSNNDKNNLFKNNNKLHILDELNLIREENSSNNCNSKNCKTIKNENNLSLIKKRHNNTSNDVKYNSNNKTFFNKLKLFKFYWCPKTSPEFNNIFLFKEKLIEKVLSLETLNKIYFDVELLKILNYNFKDLRKIDNIHFNLLCNIEIYEKLRDYLYFNNNETSCSDLTILSLFNEEDDTFNKRLDYFII